MVIESSVVHPARAQPVIEAMERWEAIATLCREHDLWLIYLAWMERILFDGRPYRHPAALPGERLQTALAQASRDAGRSWRRAQEHLNLRLSGRSPRSQAGMTPYTSPWLPITHDPLSPHHPETSV